MSEPILLVRGVEAGYRAKQILFGADFDVMQGEVIALLGANGSGTSPLLNAISGFVRSSRGSIKLGGRELVGLPPHRRFRCGVVPISHARDLFPDMTVEENLRMGACVRLDRSTDALEFVSRLSSNKRRLWKECVR